MIAAVTHKVARFVGTHRRQDFGVMAILSVVLTLAAAASPALAGTEDNLRADALSVESTGTGLEARLDYAVIDLLPIFGTPVAPYTIEVGLDFDGDQTAERVLYTSPGNTAGTTFVNHIWTQNIRPDLDALAPAMRVRNGARLIAKLDTTNTTNELLGAGEGDNFAASTPFFVEITPESLVLDGANQATLTYLVNAPAATSDFKIRFYIDDSPQNGLLDPTDTVVQTLVVAGAPGIHHEVVDYSGNIPATGQKIFARVDLDDEVLENDEANNDVTGASASATDLVAVSISYDEVSRQATLNYFVNSPTDVAPYNIEFALDRDNSGTPTPGDAPIVQTVAGNVTPGPHSVTASYAGAAPVTGQNIYAWIDRLPATDGAVDESDETSNNVIGSYVTFTTDLIAVSMSYDSNTRMATLTYLVNSPTPVSPYVIWFSLDRNNNGSQGLSDLPPVAIVFGSTSPGAHTISVPYNGTDAPASNQAIFAMIDPTLLNSVQESDNTVNNAITAYNTTPTDLVSAALTYDSNTQDATLSYVVDAPIPVQNYTIQFYLDSDNSGAATPGDTLVASLPGDKNPGAHVMTQSFASTPADSGQLLYIVIDGPVATGGNVDETDESANNQAFTSNTATTDLEAVVVTYDPDAKSATFAYSVNAPIAVDPFTIRFVLDSDDDTVPSAGDTIIANVAGDTLPGSHFITQSFAAAPAASNQFVFAIVDSDNVIVETDEGNNTASTQNNAQTDLVTQMFQSLVYDDVAQRAFLSYEVQSPIDVDPFTIAFILDTDNSGTMTPADLIIGIQPGNTAPGLHSFNQNFAAHPAAAGQAMWAILDYSPPPFGLIKETSEANNLAFTVNTAELDIQAIKLDYDSNTQTATLSYQILSPIALTSNQIDFYLETNGTPGLQIGGDLLVTSIMGELTPGGHFNQVSYAANPPASNQFLYAVVDATGANVEKDETNNTARVRNTTPTDLVAINLAYDSNTEEATLSYAVNSPIDVPAYNIEFYLDRDNSGALDLGDAPAVATIAGQTAPGAYALVQSFSTDVPATSQFIFAAIDLDAGPVGAVTETNEVGNNLVTTSNTLGTDIVAAQLAVHVDTVNDTTTADVAYTIYGPLPVAPFSLKLGVDRDGDGLIDSPADLLADVLIANAGDLTPGVHTVSIADFRSALNGLAAGQRLSSGDFLTATLDQNLDGTDAGAASESDDTTNNWTKASMSVDLVANSVNVIVDPSSSQTKARVVLTVNSAGRVNPYSILIGIDRDNNGQIDSPADVLTTIAALPADMKPGPQTLASADFRAALNAAVPAVQQNDRIIAMVDLTFDQLPAGGVTELDETSNNSASEKQRVDLIADSIAIVVDTSAGTTSASVAYTINSIGSVQPLSLKIGVDRNMDNKIDDPDGLLADLPLSGVDVTPGAHTLNVTGLRAALNGLATPLKNGDVILATLDLLLDGNDAGAVAEETEKTNNRTGQTQTVDLVANAVSITSDDAANETIASLAYTVNSPADAAAFEVRIGVDRNGDDIIDGDPSDLLTILSPSDRTPGSHTIASGNLRTALRNLTTRLADGDHIVATIDLLVDGSPANSVIESEEITNNRASQNQHVDLIASAVEMLELPGSGDRVARVNYTVSSIGAVTPFVIRVGIDSNGDKILDPGTLIAAIDLSLLADEKSRPGDRQVVTGDISAILDSLTFQNGDRIIATLDIADDGAGTPENIVRESEETQNNVTRSPQSVDLVAISLAFDSNTNIATLAYSVASVGGVPAYEIRFYLDSDNSGVLDAGDELISTASGATVPGEYTQTADYSARIPGTFQYIFAVLDQDDVVDEVNENNNHVGTNNTEITDLVANALTIVSDKDAHETTASVAYTINAPDAVSAFDIRLGVDRNGDDIIDDPADVLALAAAPDLTPGSHTAHFGDLRPALEALAQRLNNSDRIIATLDLNVDGSPANLVEELGGDETGNNVAGYTAIVDIVATAVEVFHRPATGDTVARVNYIINSPGTVAPFLIRVGIDADGDKIIDPGTLLETIDPNALGVGKLRPTGDKQVVTTGDLLPVLNALPVALQNGDRIIATLDLLDDGLGTPENNVIEENEDLNNFAREPVTVDLIAQAIYVTSDDAAGTTSASVVYTVNSLGKAPEFTLRIGIDRDGDNLIDDLTAADVLFSQLLTDVADLTVGEHVFVVPDIRPALSALDPRLQDGDRIIATLDLLPAPVGGDEGAVQETVEEGNNVTSIAGTQDQIVDIVANDLSVTAASMHIAGTYTVNAPGIVPDFRVYVGRDNDNDDIIDDVLLDLPGEVDPGQHAITADLAAALRAVGVASGDSVKLILSVDATNTVLERHEDNNAVAETATYDVDLHCRSITHSCAVLDVAFDVDVMYDIAVNDPTENFRICLYVDQNDLTSIGVHAVELGCVEITDAADKTVGTHAIAFTGVTVAGADFDTNHFFVKAALDFDNVVKELDEGNNILVRANGQQGSDEDSDDDGTPDCFDECPDDPAKTSPGVCGCGVADTDTDSDGVADCLDQCPEDPEKIEAGVCGCGQAETDTDRDGVPDCLDQCPEDPEKLEPGICGCGVVDSNADGDNDGTPACVDPDDSDPAVPDPNGGEGPAGQPTGNDNANGNGIRISVVQLIPGLPVCGIELCGTNLFLPLFGFLIGMSGLRRVVRKRQTRRRD